MATVSRLGKQFEEVIRALSAVGTPFALIGGLAVASYRVIRATQDVDLLIAGESADQAGKALAQLGYECVYRSADAANYQRGDERVDVLYATRPIARKLLADAQQRTTAFGTLQVVSIEGLIGFKLQGLVNDPRRTQDLEDIRALIRANRDSMNLGEIREYFRLFDREALLDELLDEIT
jgi:predicted nucleotidyltransferase